MSKTLVIACADPRCWKRANELYEHYQETDGNAPYIVRVGGAGMMFALERERENQLHSIDVFLGVVDHVHLEDHDGGEDQPGCAAYKHEYGQSLDSATELQRHHENLAVAAKVIHGLAKQKGREITVSTQLDHLNGKVELIAA